MSQSLPDITFGRGARRYSADFDGESFDGWASQLYLARDARAWSWNAMLLQISPTYRADTGFQSQNDYRRATAWTGYSIYPNRHGVDRVTFTLWGGGFWNFGGGRQQAVVQPGFSIMLPRQTQVGMNANFRDEHFRGSDLRGMRDVNLTVQSNYSSALRFGLEMGGGRRAARALVVPEVGSGRNARIWATLTPTQRVVLEPSISYEQLHRRSGEEVFRGYIARTRFSYQHNRELNVRLVAEYNDFRDRLGLQPLVMYQLNPFSIFYVGSTSTAAQFDPHGFVETDRQYFAKFQYLLRR
jgi:hypothetical protein